MAVKPHITRVTIDLPDYALALLEKAAQEIPMKRKHYMQDLMIRAAVKTVAQEPSND